MLLEAPLRILCFGDSLTAGWSRTTGSVYHPYAISLKSILEANFPSLNVTTDVQGHLGDETECPPGLCPGFLPRITELYANSSTASHPYDYAIILGGTNDINQSRSTSDIWTSLQKVWSVPLTHGTKVLALTVPECWGCGDTTAAREMQLNDLIMTHSAENFSTFDLHDAVLYDNMTSVERKVYWDDNIHFTPAGYDLIGGYIAERMTELVSASMNSTSNSSSGVLSFGLSQVALGMTWMVWMLRYLGVMLKLRAIRCGQYLGVDKEDIRSMWRCMSMLRS